MEVAGRDRLVAVLHMHAYDAAGGHQVVGPADGAAAAGELLGVAQIERGAARRRLLEALVLGVVAEADGCGAAGDGGRLVVGGIGDGQAVAGGHVALGIVREGRVDGAAADAGDGVRPGLPGGRIGIRADIGLGGEVADGVVGEGLHQRRRRQANGRRGQPVELIVDEALVERGVGIAAAHQLAEQVVSVGVALHRPGAARDDAGEHAGVGIEGAAGDGAVAGGLLGEMSFRVADDARLGRVGGMLSNRCRRRRGRPPPLWSRQSHGHPYAPSGGRRACPGAT